MPIKQEQFNYIEEVVGRAEDLVRLGNPDFISGFHVISMQAHCVEMTIDRLRNVKGNLKDAEEILIKNIAGLRSANPDQKPRGTAYARRMLRSKRLWQQVVSAHALKANNDDTDSDDESEIAQALKKMSPADAKIEFERHDYTLRHKLQGIKKLTDVVSCYMSMLTRHFKRLAYLENVGCKWTRRVLEEYDIEKIANAQEVVMASDEKVTMVNSVLDVLPKDFTELCALEDVWRGVKRKAEPETLEPVKSKRACAKGPMGELNGKKICAQGSKGETKSCTVGPTWETLGYTDGSMNDTMEETTDEMTDYTL